MLKPSTTLMFQLGFKRLSILFVAISILGGCAVKPKTTSDYDTTFNFSQLKRYAWIETKEDKVETLDQKRQSNAIETILNQKGYVKAASAAKADFLLKTHTVTDKKVDVDRFFRDWGYYPLHHPHFYNPNFFGWSQNSTTIVRERKIGTLVLDIVEPKKKQVIWRGTIASPLGIYDDMTPEERASKALSQASHMLATFPPQ